MCLQSPLRLLVSAPNLPNIHMERDAELLREPLHTPLLHYYDWSVPSLTYGYFANPQALLHEDQLARHGLYAARRPTGGGVIFHLTDFAFSLLIPSTHPKLSSRPLDNYAWVNRLVLQAIAPFLSSDMQAELSISSTENGLEDSIEIGKRRPTFCMAETSRYDLILGGKKIGGAAQRQTRNGLLHQGSIYLVNPPFEVIQEVMQNGQQITRFMQESSQPLMPGPCSIETLKILRENLREKLYAILTLGAE